MGRDRFPRAARAAVVKCTFCNAPAVETVEANYVCVRCGTPVVSRQLLPEVNK